MATALMVGKWVFTFFCVRFEGFSNSKMKKALIILQKKHFLEQISREVNWRLKIYAKRIFHTFFQSDDKNFPSHFPRKRTLIHVVARYNGMYDLNMHNNNRVCLLFTTNAT